MDTLENIVDKIYERFSFYKLGDNLDACTLCCLKDSEAKLLKSLPLKEISHALLTAYQDAAKPNELDLNELKYFTPRYFELIKEYQYPSYEPCMSLSRFGHFDKANWSQNEYELLENFANLFFSDYINSIDHKTYTTPIEILLMFHKGNFDINTLLNDWGNFSSIENLLHFNLLMDEIEFDNKGLPKIRNAFSDERFNEIICNWIFSNKIKAKFRTEIEKAILTQDTKLSDNDIENLNRNYELIK